MPERLAYDEAMLLSKVRLKIQDPELKEGKVETVAIQTTVGNMERPWGIEGGFAVVYKFRTKSGRVRALRCFRVPMSPDMQFRYERIGPYFQAHAREITAGFRYYDAGIVVKEQGGPQNPTYPVIEMDWIDGVTLIDRVHELCVRRERTTLKALSQQWLQIIQIMRNAHIAHGDLAGLNVMVRGDGKLVLIDYDGVYIPEFAGMTQVVLGQDDFQHPQMGLRTFDEWMDDFSALVIYIALAALAVRPELWQKYAKIAPDGKLLDVNMLFRAQDFKEPDASPLMQELEQISDQHVRDMVLELKRACLQPVEDVKFPFVLIDPNFQQKQVLTELESAIRANDDEWIIRAWTPALQTYGPAVQYRTRVQQAEQRIKALQVFHEALKTGDIQKILGGYNAVLLDGSKSVTSEERTLVSRIRSLMYAIDTGNDDALVAAADDLQQTPLPISIVFSPQLQRRIQMARDRKLAMQAMQSAFASRNVERIATAYAQVPNGQGLTTDERRRAELAVSFMNASHANDDDALLAAYDAIRGSHLGNFLIFTPIQEQHVQSVRKSKLALPGFRAALASKNPWRIVNAYDAILDQSSLVTREEREQLALARTLVDALQRDDDDALLVAYAAIEQSPHHAFFILPVEVQQRVAEVQQRKVVISAFYTALRSRDPRKIADAYHPLLENEPRISGGEREQLKAARAFVQAFADDDDAALAALDDVLQRPAVRGFFQLTTQEQERIALAKQRIAALEAFRQAAHAPMGNAQSIVDAYDASLLDNSKSITAEERKLVTIAYQYLAMCEAVRQGIRVDDDDIIRQAYNPQLAQRFHDLSRAEQKRIDTAMLSQELEDLLDRREYGAALKMAQQMQRTTGRDVSEHLTYKLRRATSRFAREQDLTNLTVQIENRANGPCAVVYWQWPADDLIEYALIVWRYDTWPEHPSHSDWDESAWKFMHHWVKRRDNAVQGTYEIPVGKGGHIYVRGYVAMLDRWEQQEAWKKQQIPVWEQKDLWRFSRGNTPLSSAEAVSPQMTWRIQ